MKLNIDGSTFNKFCKSLIRTLIDYANVVWDGCCENVSDLLESVQYDFAKIMTGTMEDTEH